MQPSVVQRPAATLAPLPRQTARWPGHPRASVCKCVRARARAGLPRGRVCFFRAHIRLPSVRHGARMHTMCAMCSLCDGRPPDRPPSQLPPKPLPFTTQAPLPPPRRCRCPALAEAVLPTLCSAPHRSAARRGCAERLVLTRSRRSTRRLPTTPGTCRAFYSAVPGFPTASTAGSTRPTPRSPPQSSGSSAGATGGSVRLSRFTQYHSCSMASANRLTRFNGAQVKVC